MATREENLKKINEQIEQLSDDELEQVAGGTYTQVAEDSVFLKELGLMDESYTRDEVVNTPGRAIFKKISDAFQKLGLRYSWQPCTENYYYFGEQRLTQKEAYGYSKEQAQRRRIGKYK